MESNNLKKPSRIQLTVIHENNEVRYFKRCKIILDKNEEKLIIIPREKDNAQIKANFERNFIQHKNILCIDKCATDKNKYFLILPSEEVCKNIMDSVKEVKDMQIIGSAAQDNDEIFRANFLIPILKECVRDSTLEEQLKPTLSELLDFYKNKYDIQSQVNGNQNDSNQIISPALSKCIKVTNNGNVNVDSNKSKKSGKRKINFDENNEEFYNEPSPKKSSKENETQLETEIYAPNFKVKNFVRRGISKSRLFIFSTADRSHCYEYYFFSSRNCYACCGCERQQLTRATIEQDSNGVDCIKCNRIDHICIPRKFQPEKYKSDLIIKKPYYELFEENINGKIVKALLLYTSADKKQYFKFIYYNSNKSYFCKKCDYPGFKGGRKYINAHIGHDKNGNELVYVKNSKHICSNMEYLETQEATVTKSKILGSRENQIAKKLKRQKAIIKKLRSNPHPKIQHPRPSSKPQIFNESKIIRKPNYRIFRREVYGKMLKKLAVFDSNDATMCYEFTWSNFAEKFVCHPCKNKYGKNVYARVIKNGDEKYVQMGNLDHFCELKKFEM